MTVELVEKGRCKAYDTSAKACHCGKEHGSVSTYNNHACRCADCKEAESARKREYYTANSERIMEQHREWHVANRERAAERSREWYAANRERQAVYMREYRETNRERVLEHKREYYAANKEREAERKREYYAANKERIAERWREYYAANRERVAERQREWQQANADKRNAIGQRRRARKMNAPGNLHNTATYSFWWNGLLDLYERCPVCERDFDGENVKPTLEHIVALNNDGDHDTSNTTILCKPCNSSKRTKDMDAWLPVRRRALGLPPLD